MSTKIIAVTGATGAQGGGLVRAILADPGRTFAARALTRNPDSEKARALKALGAEVVAADLDDRRSLQHALEGAHGAYFVTAFWEHFSVEKEQAQARNMAEAAKASGVKHAIWSTLEDTRKLVPLDDPRMPTLHGHYKVPHFDGKGEADAYFDPKTTTWLLTSFYWDNLIHFGMGPKPGPDGKLVFALPMADKLLPGIAASDIGACAFGVFKRPDLIGRRIGIAGEHLTGAQMAAALSKALGKEVAYQAVPFDVYRSLDFPGADDLGNMFQYKADFEREFCGARDLAFSRSLHPKLQTFAQWLEKNASAIG